MELLDIGRHCANPDCKRLDYLPTKCQYCKKEYCFDHSKPSEHNCNDAPSGDGERVPTCPLCGTPVPIVRGEDPNLRMEQHIAKGCHPPPATVSSKPFNSCSFSRCKERVAIRLTCSGCGKNYCIKHRLEPDHMCDKLKKGNKIMPSASELVTNEPKSKSNPKPTSKPTVKKPKKSIKAWFKKIFK
ncbi:AN1-type zinc finger protein 2B isoform X1 [Gigaspora margarita]|uniref:AN1-type zinc finger protein 2B isoform X1 n=1 Tax=Gigaspora margarita TaxID=4874 RepID=A0A8H4ANE3_GIGMA|nr:AN1-type zinc finger protein 2B isoform X1 [Gigaspora margarita]